MDEEGETVKLIKSDIMQAVSAKDKKTHYMTTNKKVARIRSNGEIIVDGSGDCTVYVYMPKGKIRKINISVE